METKHALLVNFCSFTLTGKEKSCLLSKDPINGYLPIGSILPHLTQGTRFAITRENKPLVSNSFNIDYVLSDDISLGELHDSLFEETKNAYLDQEQITASIEVFESAILPRPYLTILGCSSSIFFFKENKKIFVAEFKTSASGNDCDIYEMTEDKRKKMFSKRYITHNRIIYPR